MLSLGKEGRICIFVNTQRKQKCGWPDEKSAASHPAASDSAPGDGGQGSEPKAFGNSSFMISILEDGWRAKEMVD